MTLWPRLSLAEALFGRDAIAFATSGMTLAMALCTGLGSNHGGPSAMVHVALPPAASPAILPGGLCPCFFVAAAALGIASCMSFFALIGFFDSSEIHQSNRVFIFRYRFQLKSTGIKINATIQSIAEKCLGHCDFSYFLNVLYLFASRFRVVFVVASVLNERLRF